jgi:hypothetical protein
LLYFPCKMHCLTFSIHVGLEKSAGETLWSIA